MFRDNTDTVTSLRSIWRPITHQLLGKQTEPTHQNKSSGY